MINGRTIDIAPSILSADFSRLGEEIEAVKRGGATILHVDVMDGHFVPNLTIGLPVVKSLVRATELPIDAHLMISEPGRYAQQFVEAGQGANKLKRGDAVYVRLDSRFSLFAP